MLTVAQMGTETWLKTVVPQTGKAVEGVWPRLVQVWPKLIIACKRSRGNKAKYFSSSFKGITGISVSFTAPETITTVKTLPHSSIRINDITYPVKILLRSVILS